MPKRVLIFGGVAGGASCAARLRRLDETAEIVMFDRGSHVSFANCGLPYFVGDVITDERKLLVATSELFRQRFDITVRTRHEVTAIDRERRTIAVSDRDACVERPRPRLRFRGFPISGRPDGLFLAPRVRQGGNALESGTAFDCWRGGTRRLRGAPRRRGLCQQGSYGSGLWRSQWQLGS
jgi:NADPH-dependent 2,4-dienoyl-CoA reductase/sulfur reductase-like enzyme